MFSKNRGLIVDDSGSAYGIAVFLGVLGLASFLSLLFGHILEPFLSFMMTGWVRDFFLIMFPKGILLVIFVAMSIATLMYYQKSTYQQGGGN